MRSCVISLIGRPNVGKSTIFNRLMKKSFRAMAYDRPGVTRDRNYGILTLTDSQNENEEDLILVDTGGFYPERIEEQTKKGTKKASDAFFNIMADQAKLAIDESDLILFIVDVREGLLPFDETIANYIRSTHKPFWVVINKYDTDRQMGDEAEFYSLGNAGDYLLLSAEHDRGLRDLREKLYFYSKEFKEKNSELQNIQRGVTPSHDVVSNIAIIGSPNAGKSTLLNKLIGSERALVSDIAGTTVDPIEAYMDLYFGKNIEYLESNPDEFRKSNLKLYNELKEFEEEFSKEEFLAFDEMPEDLKIEKDDIDSDDEFSFDEEEEDLFSLEDNLDAIDLESEEDNFEEETTFNPFRSIKIVDTAGIRKNKLIEDFVEEQSVYRSLKAISESDIIIYMVDATKGITHQDRRLCDIALQKGKSIVIALNKIDLIPETINDPKKKKEWLLDLRDTIPWLSFCELIPISAKNGRYLKQLRDSLATTVILRNKTISTSKINKALSELTARHPIVLEKSRGVYFKVKYASMIKTSPPTVLLFTNKSKGIPANYRKYLVNGIRREFNLKNTPVHLIFRTTTDIERRLRRLKNREEE